MISALYIIWNNFKKHIIRNFIAIIFVTLCVYMMNISLSRYLYEEYAYNFIRDAGFGEHFYVSLIRKDYADTHEILDYTVEHLEEMKRQEKIENYYSVVKVGAPIKEDRSEFIFYGTELIKDIRYPLSSGVWFDKYESKDGAVPVIISSDLALKYKVGEEFDAIKKHFVIIGILERNILVLTPGAGGTGINLGNIFQKAENTILVGGDHSGVAVQKFVIKAPGLSQKDFSELENIVYITSFDELHKRNTEENSNLLAMQTTLFLLMLVVTIIAVSSNNIISVITNKKKYSVYFMCGMEWKTAMTFTIVEAVIKLVVPAVIGYIMFMLYCESNQYFSLRVNEINILITVILLIVIFLLTSLRPLFEIKRTSPVKIISEV